MLVDLYPIHGAKKTAEILGTTVCAVRHKALRFGLRVKRKLRIRVRNEATKATKKNHAIKLMEESRTQTKRSQFRSEIEVMHEQLSQALKEIQ